MEIKYFDHQRILVKFDKEHQHKSLDLARSSLQKYGNVRGFYRNLESSHVLGRAGEFAIGTICQRVGPNPTLHFLDPCKDKQADISWKQLKIEVKTWNYKYWEKWGRCIAVNQYPALKTKASHIVWCTSDGSASNISWRLVVEGWNLIDDIETCPKLWTGPGAYQVYNFQVPKERLRPSIELFDSSFLSDSEISSAED